MIIKENLSVPKVQINNGYRLAGNLLVPFDVLNNMSESEITNLQTTTNLIYKKAKQLLSKSDKDLSYFQLSKDKYLFLSYKNKELDLYIQDLSKGTFTQFLTVQDIFKLEWKETQILNGVQEYVSDLSLTNERRHNLLTQTLVSSSYQQKILGRAPPTVFNTKLGDELKLDEEENEKDV